MLLSDSDSDDEQRAGDVEPHQRHRICTYQVLSVRLITHLCVHENLENHELECGPVPNVMAALPNIGGALCSMLQSLADAHYQSAVQ